MRAVGRKARRARVGRIVMRAERASAEMLRGDGLQGIARKCLVRSDVGRAKGKYLSHGVIPTSANWPTFLRPHQSQPGPIGRARGLRHTFSPPEHLIRKACQHSTHSEISHPKPFPQSARLESLPIVACTTPVPPPNANLIHHVRRGRPGACHQALQVCHWYGKTSKYPLSKKVV